MTRNPETTEAARQQGVEALERMKAAVFAEFGETLSVWQDGPAGDDEGPYQVGIDEVLAAAAAVLAVSPAVTGQDERAKAETWPAVTSWDDENACHGAHQVQAGHWTMAPHHFGRCHSDVPLPAAAPSPAVTAAEDETEAAIDGLENDLVRYDESGELFGTSGAGASFLAEFLVKRGWRA